MNKLMKLLNDNRGLGVFKAESSGNEATLYLYDAIVSDAMWGGVAAADFVQALNSLQVDTIHLRINCPGGEVFAGQAMAQAVREHPANIVAHVDGYAASAASWLALACDQVVISEGAYFMIHKAMTIAWGNSDEFKKQADLLDKIDNTLVAGYVKETGQDAQQITDWMAAETWFNAEESVKYGFADSIASAPPKNIKQWNMTAWNKAPAMPPEPAPVPDDCQITQHLHRRLKLVEKQAA
jgi:ATP-dependent Clp protease, protease subunit